MVNPDTTNSITKVILNDLIERQKTELNPLVKMELSKEIKRLKDLPKRK